MTAALETIGLAKQFGAIRVANNIHFRLEPGARHALIGPNGAGKTTFVNLLTGRLAPSGGRILLNGDDVTRTSQAYLINITFTSADPARAARLANAVPGRLQLSRLR